MPLADGCLSCATLAGRNQPPGGVLDENAFWAVVMRVRPPLIAGQAVMILRRHCEDFNDLQLDELHAMSEMMQRVSRAYQPVLRPEKVHFGLYGEGVKHLHLHVLPRTARLPAGNIPLTWLSLWYQILQRLRLKPAITDAEVAEIAGRMRRVFDGLE